MNHKITVIILIYEESLNTIFNCLKSVKDFKIIIVDNANNNKRKNQIIKKFNIYKYILNKKNLGFGKANNIGIKNCDTEYLLILNPDCTISSNSIKKLLKSMNTYDDCYMTVPTFVDIKGKLIQNAAPFPETEIKETFINLEGDMCCQSALGAAMFLKTNIMKNLEMFDENFFIFYEDADLCRRINRMKKSVIQVFDAKAIHQHGEGKSIKNRFKKIYIVNFNMTFSELYYFYKINNYKEKLKNLKKKIPSYFVKLFFSGLLLNFEKFFFYLSKISAYIKFNKLLKKIN